ncbi:hypothetical protein [Paeniglutamicibacter gangotriensis]|uniref:Uncharacterized protein n=1 Tax=Paeniglutamicibacter gangotriensis Lz1y TaxID=1276920 RepID=M7MQ29_9MICC|nr:hypothetical protein [Paeniglutamicibacter gangotriensis]EMQ97040.1 hypothetical protein ADIAG_03559 [Paeniglutamicibacter gangotriensis Lz1y]
MGAKALEAEAITLPRRTVSAEDWAAVARTVPDRLLRWGSILPYYVLLAVWIIIDSPPALIVVLIFWGFFTVFSARLTPWLAATGTLALLVVADPEGWFLAVLWLGAAWFLGLGLVAGASGIRLALAVRRWRLHPDGPREVRRVMLKKTGALGKAGGRVRAFAVAALVFAVLQMAVVLVREPATELRELPGAITPGDSSVMVPVLGLSFWLMSFLAAWIVERVAGDVVLDVPVAPAAGPLRLARVANSVPQAEARRAGCSCGAKDRATNGELPQVLELDDECPLHGIEAVNALEPGQFLRVAREPWVWGQNAALLPVAEHERMVIIGLHGWGSRPLVAEAPLPGKSPAAPTHTGYRPWRTAEVFNRSKRTIRWRDTKDSEVIPVDPLPGVEAVRDSIQLDAAGIRGFAVRRNGVRPRFETQPAPLMPRHLPRPEPRTSSTPSR